MTTSLKLSTCTSMSSQLSLSEQYKCKCGEAIEYLIRDNTLVCPLCSDVVNVEDGIFRFHSVTGQQSKLFDSIYSSGYNNIEQKLSQSTRDEYRAHAPTALYYLVKAGYDLDQRVEGIKILDAACGSGWTSAAFYLHPNVHRCHIHAFDISFHGIKRLKQYLSGLENSNTINFSTQNALDMRFADSQFDLVVGSSILHHFDDYKAYLEGCYATLKCGGKAIFGEPFAIGYGLIYSAMKIAANELKIQVPTIDALYNDAATRIAHFGNEGFLDKLVDKHLFFYDEIIEVARSIGYSNCDILPLHQLEYFDDYFIDEIYNEMLVSNEKLRKKTREIYKVIYSIFKSQKTFVRSLSPFNYIVFKK